MAVKEKRGLGIGLEALFGPELTDDLSSSDRLLPLSQIEPRADQPRGRFDEESLQDLASSIARHGLIQPVIVRELPSGYYQIIAGERRWRASRMAGLTEIPVRVLQADDRAVAEIALIENLQREDLNPMEEARGYQKLIADYALTQEEAARSVGKSRTAVTNSLRLLHLTPAVSKLVEQGKLSSGHARALLAVEQEALQKAAADEVIAKSLSVRKTELLAARLKKAAREQDRPAPEPLAVDYAEEVSRKLSAQLGRKVTLSEGKNGGKIMLEYYSPDDREQLIEEIMGMHGKENTHA